MTTMAPYYAHESDIGPVFDIANYSGVKTVKMAIISLGFGCFVGVGGVLLESRLDRLQAVGGLG